MKKQRTIFGGIYIINFIIMSSIPFLLFKMCIRVGKNLEKKNVVDMEKMKEDYRGDMENNELEFLEILVFSLYGHLNTYEH